MKTQFTAKEKVVNKWLLVNANGLVLGRLAARLATILQGKHKPDYTPHVDGGDFVVVINAEKIKLTGRKMDQKEYLRFSGYPHGLKHIPVREMMRKHPDEVIRSAVRRMMPKNALARHMLGKLKIYAGAEHPHTAQQPVEIKLAATRAAMAPTQSK